MITAYDYHYSTYIGDENGDHAPNGSIWWALCAETNDRGHGDTYVEARENCEEVVQLRLEHYRETGVTPPEPCDPITQVYPEAPNVG